MLHFLYIYNALFIQVGDTTADMTECYMYTKFLHRYQPDSKLVLGMAEIAKGC